MRSETLEMKGHPQVLVKENQGDNCEFCQLLENHIICDLFVANFKHGILILNRNQSFRGRCIYVVNGHAENVADLPEKKFLDYNKDLLTISKIINKTFNPDLINISILCNKVNHLHWHIIPRYKNDSNWNSPPWPNKAKVLSQKEYIELIEKIRKNIKASTYG